MRLPSLAATAAALSLAACAQAGTIDPQNFDRTANPGVDFDQYANGGWKKANPIPPAFSRWGSFNELGEHNRDALHTILERTASKTGAKGVEQQVGDFYASGMNEAAIEAAGLTPVQADLDRIAAIKTTADVQATIAWLHTVGVGVGFRFSSEQDPKNTTTMIAGLDQGGLGLPERDYYFRDDPKSKTLREQYVTHITNILKLAAESAEAAQVDATAVLKLETALAQGSKPPIALRDPVANYHKLPVAELNRLAPHFDWTAYLATLQVPTIDSLDIGQPEFLQAFDAVLTSAPVGEWQAYLRWHVLHRVAPYLTNAFVAEDFDFFSRKLTGSQELLERWKRVSSVIDGSIGEALGQLYVAENFPPESKQRMKALVENLRTALGERIQGLEWMDAPTKAKALEKLRAFGVKIGYPDQWIDYSKLQIDRGSYVMNVLRASRFNRARQLAKIGQPVDRLEWHMTPSTVNAYYNSTMNEIVFPAGILQPPFFDAKADDAVNYGGIGAVIGHEMTHGFDDKGRLFAADGTLSDWWTAESSSRFKERSEAVVKQFNGYVAIDDLHVKGELTQGENIADLGGLKIAYAAFQKATAGQPKTLIDGFTPEQRFFLGWATVWRANSRPESVRLRVNTDPHSPEHFRVIGPLSNLDEFAQAFSIPEGAPLRRSAAERVSIW